MCAILKVLKKKMHSFENVAVEKKTVKRETYFITSDSKHHVMKHELHKEINSLL